MLQEIGTGKTPYVGQRDTRKSSFYATLGTQKLINLAMETSFEYGSRVGIWRLLNLFEKHSMRVTMYAVGLALENNMVATKAMLDGGHEIASHCWRWFNL